MQTLIKVFVIVALSVVVSLGLYVLVESQFSMSMGPGGFSPGFAFLIKMRAQENGGQIAPSFDEIQASGGGMPPFLAGAGGGFPGAEPTGPKAVAIDKGFDASAAPREELKDLEHLAIAAVIAILLELVLSLVGKARRKEAAA
ncbi:MAG: hypothetical protein CVT67_04070 [Actinobacteria bacterium HGW-Actinobacteria-7]|jgi:hypothetical protein|nr:MAG: hypothetical protein CVT67_04070 [Actinobacteria bacterium HGW-Actinobacteria-7]